MQTLRHPLRGTALLGLCAALALTTPAAAQDRGERGARERHTIVIDGTNATDTPISYEIKGGGRIRQVEGELDGMRVSAQRGDETERRSARGTVNGGRDGFRVRGPLPSITLSDPLNGRIFVDGKRFHAIVISGKKGGTVTRYRLHGGGELEPVEGLVAGLEVTRDANDRARRRTAVGTVSDGNDGYRVYGALPMIALDDPTEAEVILDGQPIHTILIDSREQRGGTEYTMSGGGIIQQLSGEVDGRSISADDTDRLRGERFKGKVSTLADGFIVAGGLPQISLDDPSEASVFVNGQPMHTLVIDGTVRRDGTARYRIHGGGVLEQVNGNFAGHYVTADENDTVDGRTAEGWVTTGKDGYRVYGEVPTVELENPGRAVVYLNGEQLRGRARRDQRGMRDQRPARDQRPLRDQRTFRDTRDQRTVRDTRDQRTVRDDRAMGGAHNWRAVREQRN